MGRCRAERIWGWRNGSGWPRSRPRGSACGRSPGRSAGRPRRSAASCGATRCRGAAPCRCTPRAATASGGSGPRSWSATSGSAGSCASACWKAGRPSGSPAGSGGAGGGGEGRGRGRVSAETIYAFVHRPGQKAEKLWKLLPRGRARRGRRRARQARGTIAGRRLIHDRPADVQERKAPGHWEGDLLLCKRTRPVLVLEERKTRFVLAARLAGKSAAETVAVLMAVSRRLDPRLRASITFDNDTAFARHGLLASACSMATWFWDAYASWQKGAVENANGRLRRGLPRDLDLDALSDAELRGIVLGHNLTRRKCLGFLTPLQALLKELGRDVQIRLYEGQNPGQA